MTDHTAPKRQPYYGDWMEWFPQHPLTPKDSPLLVIFAIAELSLARFNGEYEKMMQAEKTPVALSDPVKLKITAVEVVILRRALESLLANDKVLRECFEALPDEWSDALTQ